VALPRVNDLPRQVIDRIVNFQNNLLQGVVIVLMIALFMLGWRPALVMAAAVPVSITGAFAIVRWLGIELEQFAIASLVIALGMVVDNAIVVTDNSVRLLREGESKFTAVSRGTQELAIPMLTSTLTTIAAFLPMLTIIGNAGEYIGSLPIVVAATLGMSYLVAMLVTPIMCVWVLRAPAAKGAQRERRTPRFLRYETWIGACLKRPGKVFALASIAFLASLFILPIVGTQFFPGGERDQFFIKIWLPENSPIERTSEIARHVEEELVKASPAPDGTHRLHNGVTFIGTGGPRLMLTQEPEYDYPYYALILVNTTDASHTNAYAQDMRDRVADYMDARVTVRQFMLGPPIKNPVALRVSGPDHEITKQVGQEIVTLFKETPGTVRPFSDWGAPAGRVEIVIDSYSANLAGVTNADVAFTTSMLLSGAELTVYREEDHLIPVLLRTIREKREDLTNLSDIYVAGRYGKVPLNTVATVVPGFGPSVIARRNGIPTVTVSSDIEPGLLSNAVARRVRTKANALVEKLPDGYFIETDGELEETEKTQGQVIAAIGISVILMILLLTAQYNSLLKPAVILFAIPMGMIGVLIGLLITGWAMGFMAMLGLLSLGGIVINNAIVLVDFIESNLASKQDLRTAVANAGRVRMRPIVLTTLTTIGGLLPLSLFGGALWAPMTHGMIFGLVISTALTLFVIPSLYVLCVEKLGMRITKQASS
jgi:multidrug efflux pump subunit AcrB